MESVFRGLVIYLFLLIVFRVTGRRTLSKTTTFDLVLLLIISEVTQEAMMDSDHSVTNAALLILTLVMTTLGLSELKQHFPRLKFFIEGAPIVIVDNGKLRRDRMADLRVDEEELLEAARAAQGLARLDQIKYAVAETNGEITIVPREKSS